jgi:hypothetical protein
MNATCDPQRTSFSGTGARLTSSHTFWTMDGRARLSSHRYGNSSSATTRLFAAAAARR